MVLLEAEGFDDGASEYRGSVPQSTVSLAYGKNGYGAYVGDAPGTVYTSYAPNPIILGFDFNVRSTSNSKMMFFGSLTADYAALQWDSVAETVYFRFDNGAASQKSVYAPTGAAPRDSWHFVDMKIFQSTGSAGYVEWSLDGVPLDGLTGGDCLFVYDYFNIGGNRSGITSLYIDNVYVADTTGTVNNDRLGPVRVDSLLPDGAGNYTNMTRSDTDQYNYMLVDDQVPDDDGTYVYSDTEGTKDTYTANDTAADEPIAGVISSIVARKEDAGAKFVRPVVRIGGVDYNGDSSGLIETYTGHTHVWDESPATSSAWTATEIDGMEIGQEVRDS